MGAQRSNMMPTQSSSDLPLWLWHTLEFCSWRDRSTVLSLSKAFRMLGSSDKLWRLLIARLQYEHGVYVPPVLPSTERSWRMLFLELYSTQRHMWRQSPEDDLAAESPKTTQKETSGRSKISVYARFRPEQQDDDKSAFADTDDGRAVTLPLHQRISMLKLSGKAQSNREALRVLASEGEWFSTKWSNLQQAAQEEPAAAAAESKENAAPLRPYLLDADKTVALRKGERPLEIIKKNAEKCIARVQSVDPGSARVVVVAPDVGLREFSFDGVLPLKSTQTQVYNTTCRRLVLDFINGYSTTILAYGQTGGGKTFTMFGPDQSTESQLGIVPRACREVIDAINHPSRRALGIEATLSLSYVEIYAEFVTDLLSNGARCGHSKVASQRYVLSGAAEHPILTLADVHHALRVGDATKRRAATAMNERSSRAHAVFILRLKQKCSRTGVDYESRMFMADLGGSEQVKKSQVEAGASRAGGQDSQFSVGFQKGDRMREAVSINLGLLALKKVVESLNNRAVYTPYQDSKLTMLLSAGLGGNSKTSIICAASMASAHASETCATLRFGERCALVENESRSNANMLAAVLAELDSQIATLEAEIKSKERWEEREEIRIDTLVEVNTLEAAIGGKEVKKVSVLVGAESERKLLEQLLMRRANFTGRTDDEEHLSRKPKVVGFGQGAASAYGLGEEYDASRDLATENERFQAVVGVDTLPEVVRRKGAKAWTRPEDLQEAPETLEARAKKVNRSKLVYSGISA